ncbi:MAG: hypothetical protein MK033_05405 [Candidatus Caenarcaniphilales bacterium]|nr:hypothetical protein [Candidatus Caenarcaniphilales bacterium]
MNLKEDEQIEEICSKKSGLSFAKYDDFDVEIFRELFHDFTKKSESLEGTTKIVTDIVSTNLNLKNKHSDWDKNNEECILCGQKPPKNKNIFKLYENKMDELKNLLSPFEKEVTNKQEELTKQLKNLVIKLQNHRKTLKSVGAELISILENHETVPEKIRTILEKNNIKPLNLDFAYDKSHKDLTEQLSQIEKILEIKYSFNKNIYDSLKKLKAPVNEDIKYLEGLNLASSETRILEIDDFKDLAQKLSEIKKLLDDNLKLNHYEETIVSEQNLQLYKTYLKNESVIQEDFQARLETQKAYIEEHFHKQFLSKKAELEKKFSKLEKIQKVSEDILKVYEEEINKFKSSLINKLKIPFYIYSARILQNYTQGQGLFINKEGTGQEQNSKVIFSTVNGYDHDSVKQLSSGQLAVTAIVFILTMNKVFSNHSNLKLLAIDDPVQDMDSLNVHTFIELLRHEFGDDKYQIVTATHNDEQAMYLRYKLNQYSQTKAETINVQDTFFKPKLIES